MIFISDNIIVKEDPEFGTCIICSDEEEANALDDYLVGRDINDAYFRFLSNEVQIFTPNVSISTVKSLIEDFIRDQSAGQ